MAEIPKAITKFWVHFHEEDTEDVKVYRPRGYAFLPQGEERGSRSRKMENILIMILLPTTDQR